jgi:ligand-binding sensor domain-containing protein
MFKLIIRIRFLFISLICVLFLGNLYGQEVSWQHVENISDGVINLAINSKGDIFAVTYRNLFRTTDNGNSWVNIDTTLNIIKSFTVIIPFSDNTVFLGTDQNGLFISRDNGNSWQSSGMSRTHIDAIIKDKTGRVLMKSSAGFYISSDTGRTWQEFYFGLGTIFRLVINSSGIIIAGTQDLIHTELCDVYRSHDDTFDWNKIEIDSSNNIEVVSTTGKMLCIKTPILHCSIDDGVSWYSADFSTPRHIETVVETPEGNLFAAESFRGIYQSSNKGISWVPINKGLPIGHTHTLAIHPNGYLYVATSYGLFKTNKPVTRIFEK